MGRGPSQTNDPPMRKPRDLLADVGMGSTGLIAKEGREANSQPVNACELEHEVEVHLLEGASSSVGDEVTLRLGEPIAVISGGKEIGALKGSASRAMRSCMDFGYRMAGVVAEIDPASGVGTLVVSGERR